jgi:hypothetical protein
MITFQEMLLQIIHWAKSERLNAAAAVQDYFAEKESRITLAEARQMIARLSQKADSSEAAIEIRVVQKHPGRYVL